MKEQLEAEKQANIDKLKAIEIDITAKNHEIYMLNINKKRLEKANKEIDRTIEALNG